MLFTSGLCCLLLLPAALCFALLLAAGRSRPLLVAPQGRRASSSPSAHRCRHSAIMHLCHFVSSICALFRTGFVAAGASQEPALALPSVGHQLPAHGRLTGGGVGRWGRRSRCRQRPPGATNGEPECWKGVVDATPHLKHVSGETRTFTHLSGYANRSGRSRAQSAEGGG